VEEGAVRAKEKKQAPVVSPVVHMPEPVPSAEAQQRVRRTALRDYSGEIIGSATIVKRIELVRRMRKEAMDRNREAAARFVLLTEAHNLAIAAADVTLAKELSDLAKRDFTINRLPASEAALDSAAATLEELSSAAETPAEFAVVAENGIELADLAAADGWTRTAGKLASTALSAARKADDGELVKKATLRLVELQ
jgi:hypothetical protein